MKNINRENKISFAQLLFLKEVTSLLTIANHNIETAKEFQKQHDKDQLKKNVTNIESAENWINVHFYHYEFLPSIFHALFTGMYSRFEAFLREVATIIEANNDNRLKINDLKSKGIIDKYRKFLSLVHNINSANAKNKEWEKFQTFQFLRNKIVHNESRLTNNVNQDYKNTLGYKTLTEYKSNRIRKNGEFKIEDSKFLEDFGDLIIELGNSITIELSQSELNCS